MESEHRELTAQWLDEIAHQGLGTGGIQRFLEHRNVGSEVFGVTVNRGGIRMIARD